jgi:cyanophycin synthetase
VLIDFAHNASGYKGIEEYLQSVDATKRLELLLVLVIVARTFVNVLLLPRECLIISLFDKKIFKRKNRRRNNQSNRGIASSGQDVTYEIIPKETEAIKHAIKFAEEGSFITCLMWLLMP